MEITVITGGKVLEMRLQSCLQATEKPMLLMFFLTLLVLAFVFLYFCCCPN